MNQEEYEKKLQRQENRKKMKEEKNRERLEEYKELNKRKEEQRKRAEEAAIKLGKKKSEWYTNPYYLTFGGLGLLLIYVVIMLFINRAPPLNKTPVIDLKKIEEHNQNTPWSQGQSTFWQGATLADAKGLFRSAFSSHSNLMQCAIDKNTVIPEKFDTRTQWPKCTTQVTEQGKKCAAGYAISLAQTFAERTCIAKGAETVTPLSAQELISCDNRNEGCKGGYLNHALDYMVNPGLATEDCMKYTGLSTTKCIDMCDTPKRELLGSFCVVFGEEDIKREILANGPVVGTMEIYTDFLNYKKGVYDHGEDVPKFSGYHTVQIIGWGVDNGEEGEDGLPSTGNKYWLVKNSWGQDWGINGVAKVLISEGERKLSFEKYSFGLKTKEEIQKATAKAQEAKKEQEEQKKKQETPEDIPDTNLDDDKKDAKKEEPKADGSDEKKDEEKK